MDLPSTLYIALGAVVAATLAGVFSFVSLINQKEGKISEFRQNWIDAIRNDISKLLGSIESMSTAWQRIEYQERESRNNFENKEWIDTYHELVKDEVEVFGESYHRILMRLNKTEHLELIDELRQARIYISNPKVMFDKNELRRHVDRIVNKSQDILKEEWEVVKAGEKPYKRTKFATLVIVAILFSVLLFGSYKFLLGQETSEKSSNNSSKRDAITGVPY